MSTYTLTQLLRLLHHVIAESVYRLGGLFRRRLDLVNTRRRRWGEKREHGHPVALQAHRSALVYKAAGEFVCAPFFVAGIADALHLEALRERITYGVAGGEGHEAGRDEDETQVSCHAPSTSRVHLFATSLMISSHPLSRATGLILHGEEGWSF